MSLNPGGYAMLNSLIPCIYSCSIFAFVLNFQQSSNNCSKINTGDFRSSWHFTESSASLPQHGLGAVKGGRLHNFSGETNDTNLVGLNQKLIFSTCHAANSIKPYNSPCSKRGPRVELMEEIDWIFLEFVEQSRTQFV